MASTRRVATRLFFRAALAALAALAGDAWAVAADQASLRAAGNIRIPEGAAVAVALAGEDASERMRLLLPAVEEALHARGLAAAADGVTAAWRLTLATTATAGPDGGRFRIYGSIGSSSRPDVMVEMPLPQWPGPQQPAPYRYSVAMTLDRPDGPVLWQGAASAATADADPLPVQNRLATALIARLGETVAETPIPLD